MKASLSRLILRVKVSLYRLSFKLQTFLVPLARALPGVPRLLGIPNRDIPEVNDWVAARRARDTPNADSPVFTSFPTTRSVPRHNSFPAGLLDYRAELKSASLSFEDPFLARLPGAKILGPEGSVITSDDGILIHSTWTGPIFQRDRVYRSLYLPRPQFHPGTFYTIANNFWNNYYHWVVEILTRLFAYPDTERPRLIVNSPLASWQSESLHMLGFSDDDLLLLDHGYHSFETLYFPSHIGINPLTLNWLRSKMLPGERPRPSKRIYISRRMAARRRVLNEEELEPILLERGFTFVDLETFSFAEQVKTFSEAEMIVAIHGAGLTNMVWAPPGCKVLELMHPSHVKLMYYVLSELLGQPYWYCGGQASDTADAERHGGAAGHGNLTVPVELFRNILSDMVAK